MRYRFFMAYIPLMVAFGILSIWLADRYYGTVSVSGYLADRPGIGSYDGDQISEYPDRDRKGTSGKETFNGSELKDNGMPYAIKVNKEKNVVTVYEVGDTGLYDKPVKAMICSVGASGNTPEGIYSLGERYRWRSLFGNCYGQYAVKITGNILFHSVPYYTHNKADLEVEEYNRLGESVSAGCVRISVIDAKWIFDNCKEKTIVEIFESDYDGPMGKPVAGHIDENDGANWDPTDPDEDNPYMENAPIIVGASDREIDRYSDFDIAAGVSAIDEKGNDITKYVKVKGEVDSEQCGEYPVTYSVKSKEGGKAAVKVTFTVKDDDSPVIDIHQEVTKLCLDDASSGRRLQELLRRNVTAYDSGKELPEECLVVDYSEIFDTSYGTCHVKYMARDSEGNVSDVVVLSVEVDLEAPVLKLRNEFQHDIRKSKVLEDDYLLSLVEATDNSGAVELKLSRPLLYHEEEPYRVMYYAKDAAGNISTLSVTYQIK